MRRFQILDFGFQIDFRFAIDFRLAIDVSWHQSEICLLKSEIS